MSDEAKLASLATMSVAALRAAWRDVYRSPAPWLLSADLLARGIAYRVQERRYGSLDAGTRRALARATRQLAATGDIAAPVLRIKPGTRLVREWQGQTLSVLVLEEGFEMDGKRYGSLSEIAKAVTGTSWSGPRFFGLNKGEV